MAAVDKIWIRPDRIGSDRIGLTKPGSDLIAY